MGLVREPGSNILAQFAPPIRGTWKNTAIHKVPIDAVHDSLNVFIREGKLRTRPALHLLLHQFPYNVSFSQNIIGGAMGVTATANIIYAIAYNRLYLFQDFANIWSSIPDTVPNLATADTDVVDITFLETSATHVALFAHTSRVLKQLRPTDASVIVIPGGVNIPTAKSICIASSRVIALVHPHTVVWSRVLNYTNFDALAIARRSQTPDTGVCVRSLSALSFVLYKEYSIHTARAQAGLDEGTAFAFSEPIIVEGPAGIYAVVEVEGRHFYMTKSGRIAIFDGTNYPTWIADGIWFYLQEDIEQGQAYRIRGVYDYRLNIVVFYYPRGGEFLGMTGMVIVNLPFPGFEEQEGLRPYTFLGQTGKGVLHSCTRRFNDEITRSITFTQSDGLGIAVGHELTELFTTDDGVSFTSSFLTGLYPMPDARHAKITIESFIERAPFYGTVNVEIVTSHSLETPDGTLVMGESQQLDLTQTPVNEFIGFNKNARFFGLKYTWDSTDIVRYSGAVVYTSLSNRLK